MNYKRLVLTGGGTAGHVTPHIALLPRLRADGWDILYIGSGGIEKTLMSGAGVAFKTIATGKLRRYFSWRNFTDVFRIIVGIWQSLVILRSFAPQVVFSKGGFVSVPVAIAAWLLRIPVVTHEADYSVGLANRIIMKFARETLYTFPETKRYLSGKSSCTGLPIRSQLFTGDAEQGRKFCGFAAPLTRPVLLVVGGSSGAQAINQVVVEALPELLTHYHVVHITGKGNEGSFAHPDYRAFAYLDREYPDLLALADLAISRAGANGIFELLSLHIPMLLIPLEQGSRGDQLHNARYFVERGWAHLLKEGELNPESLCSALSRLNQARPMLQVMQGEFSGNAAIEQITTLLATYN